MQAQLNIGKADRHLKIEVDASDPIGTVMQTILHSWKKNHIDMNATSDPRQFTVFCEDGYLGLVIFSEPVYPSSPLFYL